MLPACAVGHWTCFILALAALLPQLVVGGWRNFTTQSLQAQYPSHDWSEPVVVEWRPNPTKFKSVERDEDQLNIYVDNLEPDLAIWRYRTPLHTADLVAFIKVLQQRHSRTAVAIIKGEVRVLSVVPPNAPRDAATSTCGLRVSTGCPASCDGVLVRAIEDLRNWTRTVPFPDVIFFLNAGDVNICKGPRPHMPPGKHKSCRAPVFSFQKEWDQRRDEDILVPVTADMDHPLYNFEWKRKINRAFFRGTSFCHSRTYPYAKDICSRTYLARMALLPQPGALIDVGFDRNYTAPDWATMEVTAGSDEEGDKQAYELPMSVPGRGYVPLSELARFKYLLHLDGITASNRLAKLMHTNSVVFKQKSPWIEWYYRSLVEGTHYFSFWESHRDDVFQIIKYLRHKTRYLQDVALQAQMFVHAHASPTARMLYWRRALVGYKALYSDMDAYLALHLNSF